MIGRTFWVALAAAAMLPSIAAAAGPLGLMQAVELAAERSQSARAAHASAAGAQEAALAAGQLPDPMLSAGIDNLPATGPERFRTTVESMTMKRIGISQEWVSPDKRALRVAAAQALVGRERVMESVAQADARVQAALAYLDAYYAGEAFKLTTLAEHHVHEEAQAARARLASSTGSSQDVLQLSAAAGMAQDDSAEQRQVQAAAMTALQRWVGLAPEALEAPTIPAPAQEESFVSAYPAVVQAQRDIEVAQAEASATAANRKPNWTWQVSYGQRRGLSDLVSVGVNIPLPVSPGERQDRDTAAKRALVEKAQASLEEATRAAAAEYRALASDAARLQERIEGLRISVLGPAQQRTQAALASYRSNQVPLATLFEARHAEVDVQRKLLNLQRDLEKVRAQLAFRPIQEGVQ